jgi:uncharacterized Zn-binding protein involved in type VI secretion
MYPAARKGDPATHDMIVPSGVIGPPIAGPCHPPFSPVMIEFLPAAHVNCTVFCSGSTSIGLVHPPPVPPAPPPPIVIGSPTVLIHGQPAARWLSDKTACGALLGDVKLAAMRTVLIGDFGLGAGPGGTVPAQCAYLDKPYVVTAPRPDFDRIRGTYTLSPGKPDKHLFPGDWLFRSGAVVHEVEVQGRKIEIIMPKSGAPAGKYLPTADQVAQSLAAVPGPQLGSIKQIVVSPNRNPADAHFEEEYGIKDFTSAASGGPGGVTFYPHPTSIGQADVDRELIHEGGHTYSVHLWDDSVKKDAWEDAIKKDARSPSTYADSAPTEDFSESLVMYSLSKGTPCEDYAKKLFPARYDELDKLFPTPPTPPPQPGDFPPPGNSVPV